MDRRKLLLQSRSPGQDESNWPSETPIWIWLRGIPYHCWSSDILLSIAASIGKPLHMDETTVKQRMLSFARVQVLLDVARAIPRLLTVELEAGYQSYKCPFSSKPGLMKTLATDPVLIVPTSSGDPRKEKGASLQHHAPPPPPSFSCSSTSPTFPGVTRPAAVLCESQSNLFTWSSLGSVNSTTMPPTISSPLTTLPPSLSLPPFPSMLSQAKEPLLPPT
ncbi:hypothetical protein MRB53_012816 [Persea americana]|uniref:Uncharacterized protein n=1 Tax=Persea americana TaxID=3435 RepID=A0ACC2LZS0_PERAE|nr:hypothetical protein MRB53_012816 [Persea americana]